MLCYTGCSGNSKRGYPTARQIRTTDFVAAPYQRLTARLKLWLIKRVLVAILLLLPQIAVAQPGFIPTVDTIEPFDFSSIPAPLPNSVLCNCYAFVKQAVPDLPSTKTILASLKTDGRVAVFYYPEVGLHHYALVRKREGGVLYIEETNYHRCRQGTREVSENDPHLLGFF